MRIDRSGSAAAVGSSRLLGQHRVRTRARARSLAWVLFPQPSIPSNVMNGMDTVSYPALLFNAEDAEARRVGGGRISVVLLAIHVLPSLRSSAISASRRQFV